MSRIPSRMAITTALPRNSLAKGGRAAYHSVCAAAAAGRVRAAIRVTAVVRSQASSLGPQARSRRPTVAIMPQITRKTAPTIGRGISTSSAPSLGERP